MLTGASVIFRNVANSVLPYTEGTKFSEKNTYAPKWYAPVDTYGTGNTENQGGNDFLQDVQDKAKRLSIRLKMLSKRQIFQVKPRMLGIQSRAGLVGKFLSQ